MVSLETIDRIFESISTSSVCVASIRTYSEQVVLCTLGTHRTHEYFYLYDSYHIPPLPPNIVLFGKLRKCKSLTISVGPRWTLCASIVFFLQKLA